ncbi:formate/nitrite transporter [Alkalithermobacter thermoalcaliphilus JW-YL-7 = DSM 7308]|uniref:Formate/nitrite transporter n=1 Tax=Alkalithermobacter thermoalcaliphilus JW-YL-7 = DSM 7308 TaxID=1121328 RepID=A0A150FS83_CLOPD|nr:formate/nitrite transporter [[Clostridium] paradoxum JW-YL-7 = DSM 7308]SHL15857.1 formate/nitrite transporter [[Clostridium] paradoxum JW-YL-7 = DSM 7308]
MDKKILTPPEIAQAIVGAGIKKANLSTTQMELLGLFAGMFIGFGAHAYISVMQTLKHIDVGLMKLIGGAVFPVGLMLVIMAGGELFTGNCLMTLALMDKKITLKQMLKNWAIVYATNCIGIATMALLVVKTGYYNVGDPMYDLAMSIASGKMALDFTTIFLRGVLCNILVVLTVWMVAGAQDMISKIFACWFPIVVFILGGFEHSIANMFFLPLAKFAGADMTWVEIFTKNIIPSTLGNIVGGAIIVPVVYYFAYILPSKNEQESAKLSSEVYVPITKKVTQ